MQMKAHPQALTNSSRPIDCYATPIGAMGRCRQRWRAAYFQPDPALSLWMRGFPAFLGHIPQSSEIIAVGVTDLCGKFLDLNDAPAIGIYRVRLPAGSR
jgi:hypothetical protein